MAKVSVSVATRPWAILLAKHHFWLLAIVAPLVLIPLLLLAQGRFTAQIELVREQIKSHINALQAVRRIPQHPNDSWANDIDTSTMRVKRETLAEWRKLWERQAWLRVWPESLGKDFVEAVKTLKPDGKLSPRLLERYQNNVRSLVWELPGRMGVENGMGDPNEAGQPLPNAGLPQPVRQGSMRPGAEPGEVVPEAPAYVAAWNPENQRRIVSSFIWDKKPTTAKVLLAQEELWVYGVMCDAVARVNKSSTGPHNAAIVNVDALLVGYPAAEDNPGGVGGGRIARMATAQGAAPMQPPPDLMAAGPSVGRPPNPRFGGGGGGPPEAAAAPADPDEMLRNWIYVDFSGKPLDAAQLAAAVDCQMVHLMPFVLQVVIDQRKIDALLVDLATAEIPIDVRQVRINSGQSVSGMVAQAVPATGGGRPYDVSLELRGTVGLATPPNERTVGLEPGQGDVAPGEAGEKPAPAPKAALLRRPVRRRLAA